MKLRTKIFLWIGGLFAVSFIVSQIAEELVTSSIVNKSEMLFDKKVNQFNEDKRQAVELYLQGQFDLAQAETKALLGQIEKVKYWTDSFAASEFNIQNNTWLSSAILLTRNKKIDLIQNTINDKIASMIIMDEPPSYKGLFLPLSERSKICVIDSQMPGKKLEGPFVAIPYKFNDLMYIRGPTGPEIPLQSNPSFGFFLLFDLSYILKADLNVIKKKIELFNHQITTEHSLDLVLNFAELESLNLSINLMYEVMIEAQNFLKAHPDLVLQYTSGKKDWFLEQFHNQNDIVANVNQAYDIEHMIEERYEEIRKIWQLLCFNATGLYNYDPLSFGAPVGLCHTDENSNTGGGIMVESLLSNKMASQLSPNIFATDDTRIFLGDSIDIRGANLTLAIDLRNILEGLTIATQENALFIIGNEVVRAYNSKGDAAQYISGDFPIELFSSKDTGTFFDKNGVRRYFLTITPIKGDKNLKVVLHNVVNKEFAIIDIAKDAARQMSLHISLQMSFVGIATLIVVMILIHFLSRKITTPITILSEVSHKVGSGHFDEIDLPAHKAKSKDEIDQLYTDFSQMVQGLKEKEKVKGVLNKVVSPQIATKILEGSIELGGEEKVVTVLFADIRHFTELSQNIPPTELIKLLNQYMTIMSKVVDEYEGVIDKYVGDEVMALFGAPLSSVESAHRAVECALAMVKEVHEYNLAHKKENKVAFDIGVGVHTGVVVAGNMGAENRMNYTVLGANVNLAARLCSAAEAMQVLVSKETLNSYHVKEHIDFEELKPIVLKGFSEPVPVFSVHDK
jgi:class 3 adenylate cyclase